MQVHETCKTYLTFELNKRKTFCLAILVFRQTNILDKSILNASLRLVPNTKREWGAYSRKYLLEVFFIRKFTKTCDVYLSLIRISTFLLSLWVRDVDAKRPFRLELTAM